MREHNRDKERLVHILDAIVMATITQDIPHLKVYIEQFHQEFK